jgi:ribosome-associated protein
MLTISKERLKSEVYFTAVRSRGPGGQNVNRTSSAAILHWDINFSGLFNEDQRRLIKSKLASFLNSEDQIYLRSDEFRNLEQNKSRCLDKLVELLKQALKKPKKRIATKPTRSSKEKRIAGKKHRSEVKRLRREEY